MFVILSESKDPGILRDAQNDIGNICNIKQIASKSLNSSLSATYSARDSDNNRERRVLKENI
ncbi:MAG: hypothetical protein A3I05_04475 [Deltaproteobacteria bacterium RIFCSPLOWO2_02_FULL_44_10]|nr:MAG: hypothetical protein A3C46_07280 [Deltaproteobacteria bacterium RIFCSPHIGHO2_02_FULL_44_16]OGQ46613.1 MAG: hypothetical protein A3I05_04475 [Deltaproteobacteria bacterium RIFCSPLOWO2_02_FULL_44_10]